MHLIWPHIQGAFFDQFDQCDQSHSYLELFRSEPVFFSLLGEISSTLKTFRAGPVKKAPDDGEKQTFSAKRPWRKIALPIKLGKSTTLTQEKIHPQGLNMAFLHQIRLKWSSLIYFKPLLTNCRLQAWHRSRNHCRRAVPHCRRPCPRAVLVRNPYPMGLWGLYPLAVHRQSLPLLPRQTYTPDSTLYTLCYGIKIESAAGWQKKNASGNGISWNMEIF